MIRQLLKRLFNKEGQYEDDWYNDDGRTYAVVDYTWGYPALTRFSGNKRACWQESERLSKISRRKRSGKVYGVLPLDGDA